MPIVFEQPGPLDKSVSSAYGAAQAMKDFAPFLYRPGHGGGGDGGDGGGGGGGRGGGGGPAVINSPDQPINFAPNDPLDLYRGKMEIDRQERDRQEAWIRQHTADDVPQEQQNFDEAGTGYVPGEPGHQQAPSQEAVEPGQPGSNTPGAQPPPPEFSQSDAIQLQRLQSSMSRTRMQAMSGQIDPQTAQRMIAQLRTGIDPLMMQQRATQAQAQQMQVNQMRDQNAQMVAMRNMDTAAYTQEVQRHTATLEDGTQIYTDPFGKTHILPPKNQNAHQIAQHEQAEDKDFRTDLEHVEKEVRRTSASMTITPEEKKEIEERMKQRGFHSADLSEHQAIRRELRNQPPMTGRRESEWTPQQREEVKTFDNLRSQIQDMSPGFTGWARGQQDQIKRAEDIYKRYGTYRRMPPQVLQEYRAILTEVRRQMTLPGGEPRPATPQQAAPAAPVAPPRPQQSAIPDNPTWNLGAL